MATATSNTHRHRRPSGGGRRFLHLHLLLHVDFTIARKTPHVAGSKPAPAGAGGADDARRKPTKR